MYGMTFRTEDLFPAHFLKCFNYALHHTYTEYTLYGGRGSCKSSFISLMLLIILAQHENVSAVCIRKHENTCRDSVYAQIRWAIDKLELNDVWKCNVSPLQMTNKLTGQKIFFRGCDDPVKLKSLKVEKGYVGFLWFEESVEFNAADMRSVKQTVMRGGDKFWVFDSFNPPVSRRSWKNADLLQVKSNRYIHKSTFLDVPRSWLSDSFIYEAKHLSRTNERMFRNEYLAEPTGSGANVFENIETRKITDEEIADFQWTYNGIDWGINPDPSVYVKTSYSSKAKTLYIYHEILCKNLSGEKLADAFMANGANPEDYVIADTGSGNFAINDFHTFGWNIRKTFSGKTGGKDRNYSFRWLQTLDKIVIDPERCPVAAEEFLNYEYAKDKDGNVLSGYPDGQPDHVIDAVRYALEQVYRRSGM